MTLVLIFSKFGMYLTYKNRFWGHFSWFQGISMNFHVWTRSGSKIDFHLLLSKGLIQNIYEISRHTIYEISRHTGGIKFSASLAPRYPSRPSAKVN